MRKYECQIDQIITPDGERLIFMKEAADELNRLNERVEKAEQAIRLIDQKMSGEDSYYLIDDFTKPYTDMRCKCGKLFTEHTGKEQHNFIPHSL